MALLPELYRLISKTFEYDSVKDLKERLRPLKNKISGAQGMYRVIEMVQEEKKKRGETVSTVFDLGAAVGDMARPLLKSFPSATVYCFEPFPDSFARLKKRTAEFGDRVKLFNFALYNKNGTVDYYVVPHRYSNSMNAPEMIGAKPERVMKIPVRRLDDVVKELGITHIDFMKVDVEGAEKEVFEAGEKTLGITDNIFVEIATLRKGPHSHDYIDVFEYLHRAGFSLAGILGDFFFTKIK